MVTYNVRIGQPKGMQFYRYLSLLVINIIIYVIIHTKLLLTY